MVKLDDITSIDHTIIDDTATDSTITKKTLVKSQSGTHIIVYLAYAEDALNHHYTSLSVADGTTLYEALAQANWLTQFPELALWCEQVATIEKPTAKRWHVGIYSQKQPLSYRLQAFDRIEVYRSLSADPMSQRKNKSR